MNSERDFYEEALEARMNQLEELEQTVERQDEESKQSRQQIEDLESQLNQAHFENDLLRKETNSGEGGSSVRQSEDKLVQSLKKQIQMLKEEKSEMIGKVTESQTELQVMENRV